MPRFRLRTLFLLPVLAIGGCSSSDTSEADLAAIDDVMQLIIETWKSPEDARKWLGANPTRFRSTRVHRRVFAKLQGFSKATLQSLPDEIRGLWRDTEQGAEKYYDEMKEVLDLAIEHLPTAQAVSAGSEPAQDRLEETVRTARTVVQDVGGWEKVVKGRCASMENYRLAFRAIYAETTRQD